MYSINNIKAGCNCYLISNESSSVLIDTGIKGNEQKILNLCKGKNVKLIVLTHGHIDHIQNAKYIAEKLNVPIAMNKEDVDLISDNLCREMKSKGFLGGIVRTFSVMSAKNSRINTFIPDIYLKDGDSLSEYGMDGKIIELPGHTSGSIGILLEEKNFFVGDALMNMFSPGISLLYENKDQLIKSAAKISAMGKLNIYFGHGKTVENRRWVK